MQWRVDCSWGLKFKCFVHPSIMHWNLVGYKGFDLDVTGDFYKFELVTVLNAYLAFISFGYCNHKKGIVWSLSTDKYNIQWLICFLYWLLFWVIFQKIWRNSLMFSGVDVYFRKTGLERSECIAKDLEWFSRKGNTIPAPSNPGVTYVQYLKELAETSPPLFLSHFYNIYFSHIAGGQVIAKKVC